jgi:endonuclease YncB( thermonuclease family)
MAVSIENVTIKQVVNGQTVLAGGVIAGKDVMVPVRLLYIQAPEPSTTTDANIIGKAKGILERWVPPNQTYVLWSPGEGFMYDEGGRMMAMIAVQSDFKNERKPHFVQENMVTSGTAIVTQRYLPLVDDYEIKVDLLELEEAARRAHFGVWSSAPAWVEQVRTAAPSENKP